MHKILDFVNSKFDSFIDLLDKDKNPYFDEPLMRTCIAYYMHQNYWFNPGKLRRGKLTDWADILGVDYEDASDIKDALRMMYSEYQADKTHLLKLESDRFEIIEFGPKDFIYRVKDKSLNLYDFYFKHTPASDDIYDVILDDFSTSNQFVKKISLNEKPSALISILKVSVLERSEELFKRVVSNMISNKSDWLRDISLMYNNKEDKDFRSFLLECMPYFLGYERTLPSIVTDALVQDDVLFYDAIEYIPTLMLGNDMDKEESVADIDFGM